MLSKSLARFTQKKGEQRNNFCRAALEFRSTDDNVSCDKKYIEAFFRVFKKTSQQHCSFVGELIMLIRGEKGLSSDTKFSLL